jgi:hypothetical protein
VLSSVAFNFNLRRYNKVSGLIGFGAAAKVLRGTVDGILPAGGCVAYDYRLMHRGMGNWSVAEVRPVLQFLYAQHAYSETKNYGTHSIFTPAAENDPKP